MSDRNHSIIMYDTGNRNTVSDNTRIIRCFACIGRNSNNNLCFDSYLYDITHDCAFWCGVHGYNYTAIRKSISSTEQFDNTKHKIMMTISQCFLCTKMCEYPILQCEEILKTIEYYRKVIETK